MIHVVIYGNTQLVSCVMQRQRVHEIEPRCIEDWQKALGEYGVSSSVIEVAQTSLRLKTLLEESRLHKRKVTVIIPGGYAGGIVDSLHANKVDLLIREMINQGLVNCLGSCAGMVWMIQEPREGPYESGGGGCFPGCIPVYAFQVKGGGEHLTGSKAPIVTTSLLSREEGAFQAFWSSGMCGVFSEPSGIDDAMRLHSIGDYPELDLEHHMQFQKREAVRKGWLLADETINPAYFPHAAIMRRTSAGGVAIGLGFHPEIPLKPSDITMGISPEENSRRSQKFLWTVFERLGLERTSAVDALAKQLLTAQV